LIYPPNYVSNTVKQLAKYDNKAIVSYHGKIMLERINKYYRQQTNNEERLSYRVLGNVLNDVEVDILGMGCVAFDLRYFAPIDLVEDMMTDIEVSCMAKRKDKRMVVLSHSEGWVRYNHKMLGKWTIWDHFQHTHDGLQTKMINETFFN